jgi:hypothetical protein
MVLEESEKICEWFFEKLYPNYYLSILNGSQYTSLQDYLTAIQPNLNRIQWNSECSTCFDVLAGLKSDLLNTFNTCLYAQSNLLYVFWLLNLFKPLILTVFAILLICPLLICLILYIASIYLLITKHWKLKVSVFNFDFP